MGDALAQKVTQNNAPRHECVTPKALVQWGFTSKVTQVTQFCKEVVTRTRVGELLQRCVTVCSASPFGLDERDEQNKLDEQEYRT